MPRFTMSRARKFIEKALAAPLFEHIGDPLEDDGVVRVKSAAQYKKAMNSASWDLLSDNTMNHHTSRIVAVYGRKWFNERNNECVDMIWDEVDESLFERRMDAAWKRFKLPSDTKQETYNQFSMVAFDHALGFGSEDSFERRFAEPWLLAGHLPCGWKGKVPREPKRWSDVSLDDVVGDGKLVVF